MSNFNILNKTSTSFDVEVEPVSGYSWYRIYVRDEAGSVYHDEWYEHTSTLVWLQVTVGGLSPDTKYVVNVAHASSYNGPDSTWGTALDVWTESSGGYMVLVQLDMEDTISGVRVRYYGESGSQERTWIYGSGSVYAEASFQFRIESIEFSGNEILPVKWQFPDDSVLVLMDETGAWVDNRFDVPYVTGSYNIRIFTGSGDTPPTPSGSFTSMQVTIHGQDAQAMVYNGNRWDNASIYIAT